MRRFSLLVVIAFLFAPLGWPAGETDGGPPTTQHQGAGAAPTGSGGELPSDNPAPYLAIGQAGFSLAERSSRTDITAAAEVTNNSAGFATDISWRATLQAADGSVIDETGGRTPSIAPGATAWIVPGFYFDAAGTSPATMVVTIDGARQETTMGEVTLAEAPLTVAKTKAYVDINGFMHLEGVIINGGTGRLTQTYYACGVYQDGRLAGGAYGYTNEIQAGAEAGFDTTSSLALIEPLPTDIRCFASPDTLSTFETGSAGSGLAAAAGFTYNAAGGQGKWYDMNIGATLSNPRDLAAFDVKVEIDVLDATGAFAELVSIDTPYVLPGETWYSGAFPVMSRDSDPPASLRIRVSVGEWGDPTKAQHGDAAVFDLTSAKFDVKDVRYHLDTVGIIDGTVTNRSPDDVDGAEVSCALLKGNEIVGGGAWHLDAVASGASVPFEMISSFSGKIRYDSAPCSVHLRSVYAPQIAP